VPLTIHTRAVVRDLRLQRAVVDAVEAWDDDVRIVEMDADVANGSADVQLVVAGRGSARPAWQLAQEIRERSGTDVDLRLLYQSNDMFEVSVR
jgi:hypothetical protein